MRFRKFCMLPVLLLMALHTGSALAAPVAVNTLQVRSAVTATTTNIISGGAITANGATTIRIAPSDVTGGENAGRHILTFTLITTQPVSQIFDSGTMVPYIFFDIYDEYDVAGQRPTLVPFARYTEIEVPVTGGFRYRWRINTLTDLTGPNFNDLDQVAAHRFPETWGNEDAVTPFPANGMDLYLVLGKLNGVIFDETYVAHNAVGLAGVNDLAYTTANWFLYDSIEPKLVAPAAATVTPSAATYSAAAGGGPTATDPAQTWRPLSCTDTLTFAIDVYDPNSPAPVIPLAAPAPEILASGINTVTGTFLVGGIPVTTTYVGAGVGGPGLAPSHIFNAVVTPLSFGGGVSGSYSVTFQVADSCGNIITFDGLGGPDGTGPYFANGDIVIDWGGDAAFPPAPALRDQINMIFATPSIRPLALLFPFDGTRDLGALDINAVSSPTGDGTGPYPDRTVGALAIPRSMANVPSYTWMNADPCVDPWNALTPGTLDAAACGAPNRVLNSQTFYILIEDADADGDGVPLALPMFFRADGVTPFLPGDNLIGLGYVAGAPGRLEVLPIIMPGIAVLRYTATPADLVALGTNFGNLTLRYPVNPVTGPFIQIAGCPLTRPFTVTFTVDGEGGTISPHNKNNIDDNDHDADLNGVGDGGWEYGFAASPLGNSICTSALPNNSEAGFSPHITTPTAWEYTWQLDAAANQAAVYPYEILQGGFDPTNVLTFGAGYNMTNNATNGIAFPTGGATNGELQIVYASSGVGLNDALTNPFTLTPTVAFPQLVKYSTLILPETATWGWATALVPPTSDVLVVPSARDLFGNPLTQKFVEPSAVVGTGLTGELFYLDFASQRVTEVLVSTTDPNVVITEPASPGAVQMQIGQTVYIGFRAILPTDFQATTPTGITNCLDLWTDNDCDAEELFGLFRDADVTNNPKSFVVMDNEQSLACNKSTSKQYFYWDFYGYGSPENIAVAPVSSTNPEQTFIWFAYTPDGSENPGHYGIGALVTSKSGCGTAAYVDAAVDWGNCSTSCEMPSSVEAGNEDASSGNLDENYDVVALSGGLVAVNTPPNLVPNYLYSPHVPVLSGWELFDLTGCTTVRTDGYSAGGNSGVAGIDPLNEELLGGRFAITCAPPNFSGPVDQIAFLVGNPRTSAAGGPAGTVLPSALQGAPTFAATTLKWFYLNADSSYIFPTNPATQIEVSFDLNDLIASGQVVDAAGNVVTYTEAPDGWYKNIRVAVRNSARPTIFDVWTPVGSQTQTGGVGTDANPDGSSQMNWFLDEVKPVITLTDPVSTFAVIDPCGGTGMYMTSKKATWEFPFNAFDVAPSSGLISRTLTVTGPTGIETVVTLGPTETATSFFYSGATSQGDGRYVVVASATDKACNKALPDTLIIVLDSTAPANGTDMGAFNLTNARVTSTASAQFQVAIDFTPECPSPFAPSLFALAGNCANPTNGGGKMYIYWRYGPVGQMPTTPYTLLTDITNPIDLATAANSALFSGTSDISFPMDVTITGSGRYQFGVVYEDCAGNKSAFLTIGAPPSDFPTTMNTWIDVSLFGPQSTVTDVIGEDQICLAAANTVQLVGTANNPSAQIVDPFVRLFYRTGTENGAYTDVRNKISGFVGTFTHSIENFEVINFTFTLTRTQLQTLAGTTNPTMIYFVTNAYGTANASEFVISSNALTSTLSDAAVPVAANPAQVFTTVDLIAPTPAITNAATTLLNYTVTVNSIFDVSKAELWVKPPNTTSATLAMTDYFPDGVGSTVADNFNYEFVFIADGTYWFYLQAYVECGLASGFKDSVSVCLDRKVPTPTLALAIPSPTGIANIANPLVNITLTQNPNDPTPACGATAPIIYVKVPGAATYTTFTGATLAYTATVSGTYSVYGQVTDAAGNVGQTAVQTFVADLDAPSLTWSRLADGNSLNDCYPPSTGYSNDILVKATVTTTALDARTVLFGGDVLTSFSYNFVSGAAYDVYLSNTPNVPSIDRSKTVTATLIDNAGNVSAPISYTIALDTTPPDYRLVQPNPSATSASSIVLAITDNTVNGGEANPYAQQIWYQQPGSNWKALPDLLIPPATSVIFTPPNGEGTYYLAVRGIDLAGNCGPAPTTPQVTVIYDQTPPVSTILNGQTARNDKEFEIAADPIDCTTGSLTVNVSYSDMGTDSFGNPINGSGVVLIQLYQIANGGAPTIVATRQINPPSVGQGLVSLTYTPTVQGAITLFSKATDLAGNVEAVDDSIHFFRDTTKPVVTSNLAVISPLNELRIVATATVTDTYGLDHVDWYINTAKVLTETVSGTNVTFNFEYSNLTQGGTYTVKMDAFDHCGNVVTSQATVKIDVLAPVSAITTQVADCPSAPLVLTVSYQDDVIGVSSIQLLESINGANPTLVTTRTLTPASLGPSSVTFSYTPSAQGKIALYTAAKDVYNNLELALTPDVSFIYDATAPTVSAGVTITSTAVQSQIRATAQAADNVGLARAEWSVNGILVATQQLNAQTSAPLNLAHDVSQDGLYTVSLRVFDQCNRSVTATPASITIALPGPASTIQSTVGNCPATPINLNVQYSDGRTGVTLVRLWQSVNGAAATNVLTNAFSANKGPAVTSFSYTPTAQGTVALYTTAENATGGVEAVKSPTVTFLYDTTAPTVNSGVTVTSNSKSLILTATGSATDANGLTSAVWLLNNAPVDTIPLTGNSAAASLNYTLAQGGIYVVGLQFYDRCGNMSSATVATAKVDVLAPTSKILTNIASCPTPPITLTVQYADDVCGVTRVDLYESINGGAGQAVLFNVFTPSNLGPSTTTFQYTPSGNGTITLYTIAQDANGNVEVPLPINNKVFTYGGSAPVVSWSGFLNVDTAPNPDKANADTIRVTYAVTGSPLASVSLHYRYHTSATTSFGNWTLYSTVNNPTTNWVAFDMDTAQGEGVYQFQFTGTDGCGRTSALNSGTASGDLQFEFMPPVDYSGNLIVSNANGSSQVALTFGTAPGATNAMDAQYDELAPNPTTGAVYGHFLTQGSRLRVDYRPTNQTVTVWELYFDAPTNQKPVVLSWTFGGTLGSDGVWLQDVTGTIINVDMRDQTSFVVPNGYTHLRIIQSSTHFPYVETGLPYSIVFTKIDIDGQTIVSGDEVGAFDGTLGVGAGEFEGTFNFHVTAWEADPEHELPGFTKGHSMIFKVWDESEQSIANCIPHYSQGDGGFGFDPFSVLALECTHNCDVAIPIKNNQFNLISFNIDPINPNVATVFSGLQNLEIVQNCDGRAYIPAFNINTIGNVALGDAYLVYAAGAPGSTQLLYGIGTCLDELPEQALTIVPGLWNCIGYLCQEAHPITSAMGDIANSVEIVKTSSGQVWIPRLNVNTIGNMQPGVGYWVLLRSTVTNPITFSYDCVGAAARAAEAIPAAAVSKSSKRSDDETSLSGFKRDSKPHFKVTATGQPYHVLISGLDESSLVLRKGDEIGVFDGEKCVGTSRFTYHYPLVITTWREVSDHMVQLPGFTPGNTISFRVWHSDLEIKLDANFEGGAGRFDEGGFAVAVLKGSEIPETGEVAIGMGQGEQFLQTALYQNYPNPFNPATHIAFTLAKDSRVSLFIYDASGRLVKEIVNSSLNRGYYDYIWNGDDHDGAAVPSGVYLYALKTDDHEELRRMVLLK